MRKIVAKMTIAILLVFLGIVEVSASYTAVPIKQYTADGYYSDWYLQYRNELSKEYNGKIYGSEYLKHFALWLRVEGFTEKQVNKNPNKILTIPVSGKLAENADKYVVLSDNGESVPTTVTIGEKTFAKSSEKLYTMVQTAPVAVSPLPTNTSVSYPPTTPTLVSIPDTKVEHAVITKEFVSFFGLFVLPMVVGWFLFVGMQKQKKVSVKKEKAEIKLDEEGHQIVFRIREEDDVLLDAIQKAGNLTVRDGNKIYLSLTEDGRVVIPGNVPVKNANKNIRDGLIQAYVKKNK